VSDWPFIFGPRFRVTAGALILAAQQRERGHERGTTMKRGGGDFHGKWEAQYKVGKNKLRRLICRPCQEYN